MKGRHWVGWALCLFWVGASGCGGSAGAGALSVRVRDVSMAEVLGAVVTTDPATESLTTDATGNVRFPSLPAGFYSVTAVHPSIGSNRMAVTVRAGGTTELTLILRRSLVADAGAGGATDGGGGGGGSDGATLADGGSPDGGSPDGGGGFVVTLDPLHKDSNGIDLHWSTTGTTSFTSYRVYRARDPSTTFEVVDILNAPATLTDRDEKVQLGASYRYRVGGVGAGGQEALSNVQALTAGVYIEVNSQVERMKVDPTRPYLYAIDRVNNSLHFVNLDTQTVEKTIFIGSSPTDLDINVSGRELFVANFGATEIGVVDLDTRVKSRSLFVDTSQGTWDGNPYRLVCTAGDTLVFTSQDQWNDLKLVSAVTGNHIVTVGTLYTPTLSRNAAGTRVYASGGTSGAIRYDLTGNTLAQVDISSSTGGPLNATRDGMFLFSGAKKLLANNLKSVVGTLSEAILVATSDGSVAVGMTSIHNASLFSVIKPLPLSTAVVALGPDDHTLYLYDTLSSRIYLYKL